MRAVNNALQRAFGKDGMPESVRQDLIEARFLESDS